MKCDWRVFFNFQPHPYRIYSFVKDTVYVLLQIHNTFSNLAITHTKP